MLDLHGHLKGDTLEKRLGTNVMHQKLGDEGYKKMFVSNQIVKVCEQYLA